MLFKDEEKIKRNSFWLLDLLQLHSFAIIKAGSTRFWFLFLWLQGKLTYGKIGEWRFDKRSYDTVIPPRNLPLPPPGVPDSVVCFISPYGPNLWLHENHAQKVLTNVLAPCCFQFSLIFLLFLHGDLILPKILDFAFFTIKYSMSNLCNKDPGCEQKLSGSLPMQNKI